MSEKVKQYFTDYPKSKEVHQTSDGYLFHTHNDAKNHANSLKDKIVKSFKKGAANVQETPAPTEALIGSAEEGAENIQQENNSNPDKEPGTADTPLSGESTQDAEGDNEDAGNGEAATGEDDKPADEKKAGKPAGKRSAKAAK